MAKLTPIIGEHPPPVQERPRCPYCGAHLRPQLSPVYERKPLPSDSPWRTHDGLHNVQTGRRWSAEYPYRGYGAFCSTTCCVGYANSIWKHKRLVCYVDPED